MSDPVTVCGICDIAGCAHTKERQMSDMLIEDLELARKVLAETGTFEIGQAILGEAKARIQDLEARLEAMTLQHEAALEAVKMAREEALREWCGSRYCAAIMCQRTTTNSSTKEPTMRDAPETIWATPDIYEIVDWRFGEWAEQEPDTKTKRLYRRADLPATDAQALANEKVKALVEALKALDKAASEVSRRGAVTGPQWTQMTIATLKTRAALAQLKETKE